ncbi:MAG: DUF6460 domain-containing protein [Hyphomicrobiaceae bacterium]
MDRFFGGNPISVIVRLVILSIIVGIVLSALGIRPDNLISSVERLARRIYDMGFDAIDWILGYFLLGALIVVPIWLLTRIPGVFGTRSQKRDHEP